MTTVLILAGGCATRWGNYLDVPKHLAPIGGEPILFRTVRLLLERHPRRVTIVRPRGDERYRLPGVEVVESTWAPGQSGCQVWLDWSHLWSKDRRTLVLLGDVWFTKAAIATVMQPRDDWTAYLRFDESEISPWGEDFGVGFWPIHHREFIAAHRHIDRLFTAGVIPRGGSWEVYRHMGGAADDRLTEHRDYGRRVVIDDGTEDVDFPGDWERMVAQHAAWTEAR